MTATLPPSLSAKFRESFSYFTLKDRLPIILTKIIDQLHRDKSELSKEYGNDCTSDLKEITGRLAKLKNEMQTDKPLTPFTTDFSNVKKWNEAFDELKQVIDAPTWFSAPWIFIETYMYQRIYEAFFLSNTLKDYDYFKKQKENSLHASIEAIGILRRHLANVLNDLGNSVQIQNHLVELLKISLWSNQCDLSISAGAERAQKENPITAIERLQQFVIVDDSSKVVEHIWRMKDLKPEGLRIDFILDNAGFELFCDLCLAHFLCITKLAKEIRFFVKCIPWYVSDTTTNDFLWTLNILKDIDVCNDDPAAFSELAGAWQKYLTDSTWRIEKEFFWTQPSCYNEMKKVDAALYRKLAEADLIIFKGDLNYRKLIGDRNWDVTTSFEAALRDFNPSPLCGLRTLKADLVVGLNPGQAGEIQTKNKDWMITGEYAVIQFSDKKIL